MTDNENDGKWIVLYEPNEYGRRGYTPRIGEVERFRPKMIFVRHGGICKYLNRYHRNQIAYALFDNREEADMYYRWLAVEQGIPDIGALEEQLRSAEKHARVMMKTLARKTMTVENEHTARRLGND